MKIYLNGLSIILLATLSCQTSARSEVELTFAQGYGSANEQAVYLVEDGKHSTTQLISLKAKYKPSRKLQFFADAYVGESIQYNFDSLGQGTPTNSDNAQYIDESYEHTVNEFYGTYRLGRRLKLSAGRMRVLWGHGISYIPSDFANPPLDPTSLDLTNRRGVDSIKLDYFLGRTGLTLLYNHNANTDDNGIGIKITNNSLASIDTNFVYYYSDQTDHALAASFSSFPLQWIGLDNNQLSLIGNLAYKQSSNYQSLAINQVELGNTFEYAAPVGAKDNSDAPYRNSLVGIYYDIPSLRMQLRSEYYEIGEALEEDELQQIYQSLNNQNIHQFALSAPWLAHLSYGRNQGSYLSLALSQDSVTEASGLRFLDTLSYSLSMLQGEDSSRMYTAALESQYFDSAKISLHFLAAEGEADEEFGTMPYDWNLDFLVKLYF